MIDPDTLILAECPGVSFVEEAARQLGLAYHPDPKQIRIGREVSRPERWPGALLTGAVLFEDDEECVLMADHALHVLLPRLPAGEPGTDQDLLVGVFEDPDADGRERCWCICPARTTAGRLLGAGGVRLRRSTTVAAVLRAAGLCQCGRIRTSIDQEHGPWRAEFLYEKEGSMGKMTITISPDGRQVKVEVDGVAGPACARFTGMVRQILGNGAVLEETFKPEYQQTAQLSEGVGT